MIRLEESLLSSILKSNALRYGGLFGGGAATGIGGGIVYNKLTTPTPKAVNSTVATQTASVDTPATATATSDGSQVVDHSSLPLLLGLGGLVYAGSRLFRSTPQQQYQQQRMSYY